MFDEQQVVQLVQEVSREPAFSGRNLTYADRREHVFQRQQVNIPGVPLKVVYRDPSLEDDVNAFKNRMLAAPLRLNVAATGTGDRAREGARKQEAYFYRHYYRWRDQHVYDGILFDAASLGVGCGHLRLNADALPEAPDYDGDAAAYVQEAEEAVKAFVESERGDLFVFEHVDMATVMWTPGMTAMMQAAEVPLAPLMESYRKRGMKLGYADGKVTLDAMREGEDIVYGEKHWSRTATLYTVEDSDYCYHVMLDSDNAGGKLLGVYRNYFGRPNFYLCPAEVTGHPDPLLAYRPLIAGKYQTSPIESLLVTAMLSAGIDASQQRLTLRPVEGVEQSEPGTLEITVQQDGVLLPPEGYEIQGLNLQVGFDLPKAVELIRQESGRYGFPKAINRPEEVAASSGYDRARQQDAVASLLDPPLGHFATMVVDGFKAMAVAVKEIGLPLRARNVYTKAGRLTVGETIELQPGDIVEADITADFNSVTLFSRIAQQEEGLKLMEADQLSETEFQEDYKGVDDVEAFFDQRSLDKVRKAADEAAVADALRTIEALRGAVASEAVTEAGVAPMVETTGGQVRRDRGPSIATGPGSAMPVEPTPPGAAELGAIA